MELESKEVIPLVKRGGKTARYERLNKKLERGGSSPIYHQEPFTLAEYIGITATTMIRPGQRQDGHMVYLCRASAAPAMNISSMTRSRLRRRVSRDRGAPRPRSHTSRHFSAVLVENLVMTVAGTVAGVLFSLLFCKLYITTFFPMENAGTWQLIKGGPSFSLILTGKLSVWRHFFLPCPQYTQHYPARMESLAGESCGSYFR